MDVATPGDASHADEMNKQNHNLFLFIILAFLALNFYLQVVKPPEPEDDLETTPAAGQVTALGATGEALLPAPVPAVAPEAFTVSEADLEPIIVETDVYRIEFTPLGARPTRWEITDPLFSGRMMSESDDILDTDEPRGNPQVIPQPPPETGIVRREMPLQIEIAHWPVEWDFNRLPWRVTRGPEEDADGAIHLAFESPTLGDLVLVKEFTFHQPRHDARGALDLSHRAGGYLSAMTLRIRNVGDERVVRSDEGVGLRLTWGPGVGAYERGGIYSRPSPLAFLDDDTWYKIPRENKTREIAALSDDGIIWAGLQSRYFLAAIVPTEPSRLLVAKVEASLHPENIPVDDEHWGRHTPLMTVALEHPRLLLDPGQEMVATYDLYVGPKQRDRLLAAGHDLARANFHSSWFWMRGLSIFLTRTLEIFYAVIGNHGWSILLLTIVIRLLLYPLTHRQMRIMAKTQREMARVKPFINEVREKHKGDQQKIQRETMAIYREHGVNPFAGLKGCLPMLLQMPIFFALWRMLASSIELRGATWLWINDLSGPDALFAAPWLEQIPLLGGFLGPTLNLLPILMALTQWLTMKFGSARMDDPNQRAMMTFMPIMLTVMLYRAPSGLMLYWVAGNIWQMGHQLLTNRSVQHEEESAPTPPAPPSAPADKGKGKPKRSPLAQRREEAAKARRRAAAESKSLPRWARRGS